jgi:hypothetical protein
MQKISRDEAGFKTTEPEVCEWCTHCKGQVRKGSKEVTGYVCRAVEGVSWDVRGEWTGDDDLDIRHSGHMEECSCSYWA